MAITFVNSATAGGTATGVTSGAIDTSGGDLLVVVISDYAFAALGTLSDSKSNTWNVLASSQSTALSRTTIYYAKNPTVGSSHTFTFAGTSTHTTINVFAFTGCHLTAPFDQQTGAMTDAGTSLDTGSVTPGEDNEVLVAGLCFAATNTISIDDGFSSPIQTNYLVTQHMGGAASYKIQTTAGAENPTLSWSGSTNAAARIATFKAAAAAGTNPKGPLNNPFSGPFGGQL